MDIYPPPGRHPARSPPSAARSLLHDSLHLAAKRYAHGPAPSRPLQAQRSRRRYSVPSVTGTMHRHAPCGARDRAEHRALRRASMHRGCTLCGTWSLAPLHCARSQVPVCSRIIFHCFYEVSPHREGRRSLRSESRINAFYATFRTVMPPALCCAGRRLAYPVPDRT